VDLLCLTRGAYYFPTKEKKKDYATFKEEKGALCTEEKGDSDPARTISFENYFTPS